MTAASEKLSFDQTARIPAQGDNAAIASRRLEAAANIEHDDRSFRLSHTVLEGHRFAHRAIGQGAPLLSWGLPFGKAVRDIAPGEYLCNAQMLTALAARRPDFELPPAENFVDHRDSYQFDETAVSPGRQVERCAEGRSFDGYARGGQRGVGTRNYIVILGTSSLTGSYVRALADRFKSLGGHDQNVSGVVAVAHTEGGDRRPNNLEFTLRTLSGFMVHPNVGAVLAVDFGDEAVNNGRLREFLLEHGYPLEAVLHQFMSLGGATVLERALDQGHQIVDRWLEPVSRVARTRQSVSHLRLALQCGGSDAFSGVSGNPLSGLIAAQTLRCGGSANLAETDELIGAEPYMLANVRDAETAWAFLHKIEIFTQRAALHGHDAEGNLSGGNRYRGLYNIALKSIGAARKKDPEVRLDYVIGYSERMGEPGFYFMDSPGNDLESIAGQVASGANVILFTTGNGSITNFPFVPTIKIITTTNRYRLIRSDMDVNAGRYQDGVPMEELGAETFVLALRIASGQASAGEKSGHSQVQLWRDWPQIVAGRCRRLQSLPMPSGQPLAVRPKVHVAATFSGYRTADGFATDQVGAVVPTSLCSGQIARLIVQKLNDLGLHRRALSRYVTFVHTEGCGASGGDGEAIYLRTLIGHLTHPSVKRGLLLEHGCEKTHNDAMRSFLEQRRIDATKFGWASVQLDGGIDRVADKVIDWFDRSLTADDGLTTGPAALADLWLGLTAVGPVVDAVAAALARMVAAIVTAGGVVVVPANASLVRAAPFLVELLGTARVRPSLAYGQRAEPAGFHVMDTPTQHVSETLAGLGATGVGVMLAHVGGRPVPGHPMIPLLQVSSDLAAPDMDRLIDPPASTPAALADELLEQVLAVASRQYTPRLFAQAYTDFQITRGKLGISM